MVCIEQNTKAILSLFDTIFNPKTCRQMAHKHKFIQRASSKLEGHDLIKVLVLPDDGVSEDSLNGLCLRLKKFNPKADISASALSQRLDTSCVAMIRDCFRHVLQLARNTILKEFSNVTCVLGNFGNVYIEDSTACDLNNKLRKIYKGTCRGSANRQSQVKIDLIHNFTTGTIVDAAIFSGNVPDQGLSGRIIKFLKKGDLVIRDQGYFCLEVFQKIEEVGAHYLSRIPPHIKVYLNPDDTEEVNLAKYIDRKFQRFSAIDITVFIGANRQQTRLIAYRLPENVVRERLRQAHKRAKSAQRQLSDAKRTLLKFAIFITSVPAVLLPVDIVGTVYRIRWEIELIFKQWKGLLKIDILDGISINRINCLLWARLCTVVLVAILCGHFMNLAQRLYSAELSSTKLIRYLLRESKLCMAIASNTLEQLLEGIASVIRRRLLKDKRERLTMRQKVNDLEPYYGVSVCMQEVVYK